MRRPQRGAKSIRIACLFQQLAGLGRIVRPGAVAFSVGNRRWHHAGRRGGIARKGHLHQRLTVDGVVNRLAHFRVIERLLRHVHADIALHDRRAGHQLQLAVFLQQRRLLVGDRERKLRFAGLQHRRAGIVIHHRTPGNGVQLRQPRLPVTGELLHFNEVGLIPGVELVRTGADRMETNLFTIFLQRRRRNHRRCRVGQDINKRRERLFEGNFHRRRVNRLGAGDIFIQVIALEMIFRIAGAIEVGLDRFGIKLGTVLELHPRVQLNGINQPVRRNGIAFRQHVMQFHLFIQAEQPLIERLRHRLRQRVVSIIGVEGRKVRTDRHHHIFCGKSRRRCQRRSDAQRQQPFA